MNWRFRTRRYDKSGTKENEDGRNRKIPRSEDRRIFYLERETRFELATSTLARSHSTTELFPLENYYVKLCAEIKNKHPPAVKAGGCFYFGAGNEIRTRDFDLGKVALYH